MLDAWIDARLAMLQYLSEGHFADRGDIESHFRDDARVGRAIDAVRDRFGYDAIRLGSAGERSSWLD